MFVFSGGHALARFFVARDSPCTARLIPDEKIKSFLLLSEQLREHSAWFALKLIANLNKELCFHDMITR